MAPRLAGGSEQGRVRSAGGREQRRGRGEKREERDSADKWASLPCGVHVSETGPQNRPMVKNEWFS